VIGLKGKIKGVPMLKNFLLTPKIKDGLKRSLPFFGGTPTSD